MKTLSLLAATVLATASFAALAQHNHAHGTPVSATAASAAEMAEGEVRRVDPAKGTVLIKHGEIKNLGMGPMTMSFKLQDPKAAGSLKAGDKIKFVAIDKNGELIVTRLEKAN